MMPDPNDPLDPANIDKMLEARLKVIFRYYHVSDLKNF